MTGGGAIAARCAAWTARRRSASLLPGRRRTARREGPGMSHEPRESGDHDQVRRIVSLSADRDTVWAAIGGFGQIADWHPLIASVELTEIEGESYRHLRTTEGELFLDRQMEAGPHHLTYETMDGPLPVSDHRATLSCVAEPGGCHVHWSAYFVPTGPDEHMTAEIVGAFYEIGLQALQDRFGSPAPAAPA
jgi:Polyketide cyclase / dehydrase and lipid transport